MSPGEINEAIGKLVSDYSSNETKIAAITNEIRDIRNALGNLHEDLRSPGNVKPSDKDGGQMFELSKYITVVQVSDMARLYSLLVDYHVAMTEKREMEQGLKQAKLDNLIVTENHAV